VGGRERINIKNRRSSEAIFFLKKYRDLGEREKGGGERQRERERETRKERERV